MLGLASAVLVRCPGSDAHSEGHDGIHPCQESIAYLSGTSGKLKKYNEASHLFSYGVFCTGLDMKVLIWPCTDAVAYKREFIWSYNSLKASQLL